MSGSNALQITDPNAGNALAQAPSWADAAQSVAGTVSSGVDALGQWLAAQRAKSAKMGLWNDVTGLPTGAGLVNAAQQTGNALLMGTTAPGGGPGITAYHGSPYDFERFDTSKIGTGEGAQAYGHGLYFAGNEGVARSYRDKLSEGPMDGLNAALTDFKPYNPNGPDPTPANIKTMLANHPNTTLQDAAGNDGVVRDLSTMINGHDLNSGTWSDAGVAAASRIDTHFSNAAPAGSMYQVNIGADPNSMLQWDQTVGQHPPALRDKLLDMGYGDADRGADVYAHMARGPNGDVGASQRLQDAGIPGISYLDAGSRGSGQGTKNHVVFDANTIDILRKYGIAGLMLGGAGAAAANGSQQPPTAQ